MELIKISRRQPTVTRKRVSNPPSPQKTSLDFPLSSLSSKKELLDNDLHAVDGLYGNRNSNPEMGLLPSEQDLNKLQNEEAQNMTDNNTLSITELQTQAEAGDAQAQLDLAYRLVKGEGIDQNIKLALQWITQAAELNNLEASLTFCSRFKNWESIPLDPRHYSIKDNIVDWDNVAFELFLNAAEKNCGEAHYQLFWCYWHGYGVQKNRELAVDWLKKAAENGVAEAQDTLGVGFKSGVIGVQNNELAFEWFEKAAMVGFAQAQYNLACCYLFGNGIEQNDKLAYQWLTKFVEHGQNTHYYGEACLLLGELYAEGKGVQQSYELAIPWYEKKAEMLHDELVDLHKGKQWNENFSEQESKLQKHLTEIKTRLAPCYHRQATRAGLTDKEAYIWHEKAAEGGYAQSQYWLARYCLSGGLLEQSDEPLSKDLHRKCISDGYVNTVNNWAYEAVENGCAEANLILGFCIFYNIGLDDVGRLYKEDSFDYFKAAIEHSQQGIAEYFLAKLYADSYDEQSQELAKIYSDQADLDKVWKYYDIDRMLKNDESLRSKLDVLLKDKELGQLTLKQLRLENQYQNTLLEKEKEMLSFFTHTMRNALATAPESLRQAIQLLGSDVYEKDTKHYQAINKIAALFSTLTLTDCLIDTFKQSVSDPQEFKQAWENDHSGDATPLWVIAAALRQSLNRIFFMSDASDLKKLLIHPVAAQIKATRKSFIDEVLPLNSDQQGVNRLYAWVNQHVQCLDISISDADGLNFGANKTRFSLLFAITSELILNALRYWDGEDKIQISWMLADSGHFVFSVKNHCKPNATSNLAGTHKGLAFIKRLIKLLGEQARFDFKTEEAYFTAELTLNKTLLGDKQ